MEEGIKRITRDGDGLIADGSVEYKFTDDGQIDWRKMIKPEYLVPNKSRTSENDVTKLKDYQLIILLGGIKELAQIRGYTDVNYDVVSPSSDYVVATCSITWTPNYETEDKHVTFSAIGDASPNNTKDFAKFFLGPIAENRAFVRCVRNFLKINIVSQEELGDTKLVEDNNVEEVDNPTDPTNILADLMKKKNIPIEKLKKKLESEGYEKAGSIASISDLPKIKVFELIDRLKKFKG